MCIRDSGRELAKRLHARIPILAVDFCAQNLPLEVRVFLEKAIGLDNLRGIGGGGEHLRHQRVRIQRDRRDQLMQLLGGEGRILRLIGSRARAGRRRLILRCGILILRRGILRAVVRSLSLIHI